MIDRREILEAASSLSLLPHIVEKDYVLGWILAGINAHEELSESWIFKGGTCLKKCYFETYRFSEDLDFTLRNEDHLDEEFLRRVFEEVVSWATDQSGLNIPADQLEFDIYDNPRGRPNCQGKIAYRGPVSPTSGGWPKIKLDLTADERLVLPSVRRECFILTATVQKAESGPIATPMRKPSEKNCAHSVNARGPAIFTTS
jgi:predicted nucleotidyltransferase component of viral defense system